MGPEHSGSGVGSDPMERKRAGGFMLISEAFK
jgi:hypothetical protein